MASALTELKGILKRLEALLPKVQGAVTNVAEKGVQGCP